MAFYIIQNSLNIYFYFLFLPSSQVHGLALHSRGVSSHESSKSGAEDSADSVGHSEVTSISSNIMGLHFPSLPSQMACNQRLQCTKTISLSFSTSTLFLFLECMLSKVFQFHLHQWELQGWLSIRIAALWIVGISYPYPAHQSPKNA